jgi:hypothetical protein
MSDINIVNANNLKSTKESRTNCLSLLNEKEKNLFLNFVKSVEGR